MKRVPLRTLGEFKAHEIFTNAIQTAPEGMKIPEMRLRERVFKALEKASDADTVTLEDADHQTLVKALEAQPWAIYHPNLMAILDDVINAPSV